MGTNAGGTLTDWQAGPLPIRLAQRGQISSEMEGGEGDSIGACRIMLVSCSLTDPGLEDSTCVSVIVCVCMYVCMGVRECDRMCE